MPSIGALSGKNRQRCSEQNSQVGEQAESAHVIHVVREHGGCTCIVMPFGYLPKPGKTGSHQRTELAEFGMPLKHERHERPRADQAHFAFEYIEKLGQFIQAGERNHLPIGVTRASSFPLSRIPSAAAVAWASSTAWAGCETIVRNLYTVK